MKNIKSTFLILVGLLIFSSTLSASNGSKKDGIQLYTLRNEIAKKGIKSVLEEVSKIGFKTVETYGYSVKEGYWGLTNREFKDLLDKNNLVSVSGHFNFNEWEKTQDDKIVQDYIASVKIVGQKYIIMPGIDHDIFKDEAKLKAFATKLNRLGKLIKDAGLKFAYHNHAFEFEKIGNKTAYEMLIELTDKDLVAFELDLYWVARANYDVLTLFKKCPKRFPLWHIKDMSKLDPKKNTPAGNGTLDFNAYFKKAKRAGLEYCFIEQDNLDRDAIVSVKEGLSYLKTIK